MSLESQIGVRKCVHVKLMVDTHAGLRVTLFRKKLSIQETLEELAQRIAAEDPHMMKILDKLAKRKREEKVRQLRAGDADTLFDVISRESPLVGDDDEEKA